MGEIIAAAIALTGWVFIVVGFGLVIYVVGRMVCKACHLCK